MTKTELISLVTERTGVAKKDAERVVNATFDTIASQLIQGEKVQISGFGTFETQQRQARTGRNPVTGESISIAPTRAPVFKAGKTLKESVAK